MNKTEAIYLISKKMGKQEIFPSFTRGEAILFEKIVQRTKTKGQGPDFRKHDIEKGFCPSNLKGLFRAAHYTSYEWARRSLQKLMAHDLITVEDVGIIPHPRVLECYPDRKMDIALSNAARQKKYRENQKLKLQMESEVPVNG